MFGGNSYDAIKGSLAPIGARRHLPTRILMKKIQAKSDEQLAEAEKILNPPKQTTVIHSSFI